uniref:Unique cartilage matrix-associated protein n=1 Tax=Crocodylus porosus TaxID=8502 RepID=A0A7M4FPN5_CROPO
MNWKQILFLSCLATFVLLTVANQLLSLFPGLKKIFIQESDASNFFKKRSRRSTSSIDELNAETRQMLAADEQRREYFEEQRNEHENFVEEERHEQNERTREQTEQWRQYHYDGLYPSYLYNRHHI